MQINFKISNYDQRIEIREYAPVKLFCTCMQSTLWPGKPCKHLIMAMKYIDPEIKKKWRIK